MEQSEKKNSFLEVAMVKKSDIKKNAVTNIKTRQKRKSETDKNVR